MVVGMEASEPVFTRNRRWIATAAAFLALAILLMVEPMRCSLPARYLVKPLDIHRTGSIDFTMCMRAELSPAEAQAFARRHFDQQHRVRREVAMNETMCPAPFWPTRFGALTSGYLQDRWPDGTVEGTTGAVYENGYLYFWSNTR